MLKKFKILKGYFTAAGVTGMLLLAYPALIMLLTRKRGLNESATVDVTAGVQVVFIFICFAIILKQYSKHSVFLNKIVFKTPNLFLLIYIGLGFLSTIWSSSPSLTIYRSFESLTFFLLIALTVIELIRRYEYKLIIKWVVFFALWNLAINILFRIKVLGLGYFSNPFTASRLFFPLFFFIFMLLVKNKPLKIVMLAFAILGLSNKIYFGICAGLIGLLFSNFKYKFYFGFFAILALFLYMYFGLEELLLKTVYFGRDSTGLDDSSGRNQIWNYLYKQGLKKPILGHGFVAGETNLLSKSAWTGAINSHNSLMSTFVNIGLVGLLSIIFYFLGSLKMAFSNCFRVDNLFPAFTASVIMIIVVNMAAPGIGGRVYGVWLPSVFIITLISGLKLKIKFEKNSIKKYN